MFHFLSKFRKAIIGAVIGLCLGLLLCPLNVHAASGLEVTVKSPTNPDHIFTGEEAYDLTVYLQGDANETYQITYRVVDSRKLALVKCKEPISITLGSDGKGELLLDLSSLKGRDTFRAEVTVSDASGAVVGEASCTLGRVALASVTSHVANVRNGVLFSTDDTIRGRYLYLKKDDHIPETLIVSYWITDNQGHILRQLSGLVNVPTKDYTAVPLNFYGLESYGQCRIAYAVYDDSGNLRSDGSAYFHHYGVDYFEGRLVSASNKLGLLYANDEAFDLTLELKKTDPIAEVFSMRYTVSDGFGNVIKEFGGDLSMPEKGTVQIPLDLADLTGYGLFTLTVSATDKFGNEKALTLPFSRVLATAKPGDLPLVNINDHFTVNRGEPEPKLELSAQAGFGMWRSGIPWLSVEKSPGNYSMPAAVELVMRKTEALGMEPLIILAYGNDNLYGLPDPTNPTWLAAYCNYCKYVARYFGDRVTYYEIWNEWNHSTMGKTDPARRDGRYYAMVLAAASKAIKSVNPNAKIIGGAMAGHSEAWMVDMLSYDGNGDGVSDAMEAMDGFSFHTYATDMRTCFFSFTEHNYPAQFDEVIEVLNRYGDASTKEIWLTETGWSTCIGPGVTEETQAAYMVQMYTWALTNPDRVDRLFWYDLMNDCDTQTLDWDYSAAEHNWGLIHCWASTSNETLPYSAKKGYVAICAMTSVLSGATDGSVYELDEGIYAYRFQKDGQDLIVAWTHKETKVLNVSFSGNLVITDMYGNATTHTGSATLNLSECPIYIQGDLSGLTVN